MRYTGPRNRLARREGIDLGLKTVGTKAHATLLKKLNIPPGQHGAKGKRKISEHARQLREKQKLCRLFSVTEKQLKNYFTVATKTKGNTGVLLSAMLERRLDAVVYRLGLAPTMAAARQLVTHKHVRVNDKVVSIPSYLLEMNNTIQLANDKTKKIPYIAAVVAKKDTIIPPWLQREGDVGKLADKPTSELIEKQINLRFVVEFYSR